MNKSLQYKFGLESIWNVLLSRSDEEQCNPVEVTDQNMANLNKEAMQLRQSDNR